MKCDYRLMKVRNIVLEIINNIRIFLILLSYLLLKVGWTLKKGDDSIKYRRIMYNY